MAHEDFYKLLGVERNATADQIKSAYRKLAKQYHPDRNPNDPSAERKFKEVQEAYRTLSDPKKREEYDQFGRAGVGSWRTDPRGQRVYTWGGGSTIDADDLEDLFAAFGGGQRDRGASIFDQFFGGGRGPSRRPSAAPRPSKGADIERSIDVSFEDAVHGTTVSLTATGPPTNGRHADSIEVKIPPGVRDGQRMRLRGKGQPGANGGPPGDLFLICRVRPHAYWRREGADIYLDVPISITEAALGAEIEVPTLEGRAAIKIPPGTRSGTKLRLKGRGGPKGGGSEKGDLYAMIQIAAPKELTPAQREALITMQSLLDQNPRVGPPWSES